MGQLLEFISNHPLLALGVVSAGLAVVFNELKLKGQSVGSLSTAEAVQLINGGAVVLDIRDSDAFAQSHMIDAENVTPEALAGHKALKKNKNVLLVCDNGSKSSRALAVLKKEGLQNVFILKGGVSAWQQDNLPLEGNA